MAFDPYARQPVISQPAESLTQATINKALASVSVAGGAQRPPTPREDTMPILMRPDVLTLKDVLESLRAVSSPEEQHDAVRKICLLPDWESRIVASDYARAKNFAAYRELVGTPEEMHAHFLPLASKKEKRRKDRCYFEIPLPLIFEFIRRLRIGIALARTLPYEAQDGILLQACLRHAVPRHSRYFQCSGLAYDGRDGLTVQSLPVGVRAEPFEGYIRLHAPPRHWRACENRATMHKLCNGDTSGSYLHLWATYPLKSRIKRSQH